LPPELLGPYGLVVALLIASAALWRSHVRSDEDVRTQRDVAITGWRAQTDATNRLADLLEDDRRPARR
jgi:hypothetical protein